VDLPVKNYQIGLVMVGMIVLIAVIGLTTHQDWLAFLLVAAIVVVGLAGIARGYRRRNR
jgi:archaellum biogenesis protein FlaJ (TadC family)